MKAFNADVQDRVLALVKGILEQNSIAAAVDSESLLVDVGKIRHTVGDQTTAAGEWEMSGTFSGESFGQAPTGKQFRVPGCCVMQLIDGRIAAHRDYSNEPTFDRQVKATPSDTQ